MLYFSYIFWQLLSSEISRLNPAPDSPPFWATRAALNFNQFATRPLTAEIRFGNYTRPEIKKYNHIVLHIRKFYFFFFLVAPFWPHPAHLAFLWLIAQGTGRYILQPLNHQTPDLFQFIIFCSLFTQETTKGEYEMQTPNKT